jgi:hypothetical protein
MTTQTEIRASFWEMQLGHPPCNDRVSSRRKLTQNDYNADIRCAFVDYVDSLRRNGEISEALASRVTL